MKDPRPCAKCGIAKRTHGSYCTTCNRVYRRRAQLMSEAQVMNPDPLPPGDPEGVPLLRSAAFAPATLYDAEGHVIGTMDPVTRERQMIGASR